MTPQLTRESSGRFGSTAHGAVLASAFCIFAWPLTTWLGATLGMGGAFIGSVLATRLLELRFRLLAILGLAAVCIPLGSAASFIVQQFGSVLLGAELALAVDDGSSWFFVAFGSTLVLRACAIRYRAATAVEGGVVVTAVATTVAAHRDGMIARPLAVADWFWTQGLDPVVAFLGIGMLGALLFAAILAHGRSRGRTVLQLLFVLVLGIVVATRIHSADPSQHRDAVGGQSKDKDEERADKGGTGGGSGKPENQNQDFQNDLPNPGGGKNRPSAVVVFHREVVPSTGVFYFRHAAFSQYNGVRLVEATQPDIDPDARFDFPVDTHEIPEPPGEDLRTTVSMAVALLTQHNRPFALIDPIELAPMANPEPARFRRAYAVVSSVLTAPYDALMGTPAGEPDWPDQTWEHYTRIPKDPRYRKLAEELRKGLKEEYKQDPMALAMVVKRYLEQTTTYSFKKNYEGEEDPTAAFLFGDDKRGYCVHTSHSAAYLLRALGVPSRVSAGYAVPSANLGGGSSLLIKNGDAHAWAEIYLAHVGWVPIEVTPEKTDVDPPSFSEQDLQQMLGEMARQEGEVKYARPDKLRLKEVVDFIRRLVPWLLAFLLLVGYGIKLYRLQAPRWTRPDKLPRVAYRAALDQLSMMGFARKTGESRERFLGRVRSLCPSFETLTASHLGAAFGSRGATGAGHLGRTEAAFSKVVPPAQHSPQLRDSYRSVGREIRRHVPWYRRALGILNPFSFLLSK